MTTIEEARTELAATYDRILDTEAHPFMYYREKLERFAYTLPENALRYSGFSEMRRHLEAAGSHYYDRDAVRFFRGRTAGATVGIEMLDGRFWIESRQFHDSMTGETHAREYQVAWISRYITGVTRAGDALSVEKLGELPDLPAARGWLRRLASDVRTLEEASK